MISAFMKAVHEVANAQDLNVTVVEPDISIDKSVSAGPYDAGDTITYTIVISNSSAAMPPPLLILTSMISLTQHCRCSHTQLPFPVTQPIRRLFSGQCHRNRYRPAGPGDNATITIEALIPNDTPAYLDIPNIADVTYTSLPDDNGTT